MANAARGEAVLWLIGVDQKRGVIGAGAVDVAIWYPQVEKHFDGHAPEMRSVNFTADGLPLVVLLFETERAPFVVRNPKGGYPEFTVPWRGETRLRAAKRDELLRIFLPLRRLPNFTVTGAALEVGNPQTTRNQLDTKRQVWRIVLKVLAELRDDKRVEILFDRCTGELSVGKNPSFKHEFTRITVRPFSPNSTTIIATQTEVMLTGSGACLLTAEFEIPNPGWGPGGDASATFNTYVVGVEQPAVIDVMIPRSSISRRRRWAFGDSLDVFDQVTVLSN